VPERKREHGSHSKKRMRANKRFITADEWATMKHFHAHGLNNDYVQSILLLINKNKDSSHSKKGEYLHIYCNKWITKIYLMLQPRAHGESNRRNKICYYSHELWSRKEERQWKAREWG
jgi:hypothetical protein